MNNDDARFCDSCGAQLAVTDTPPVGQDAATSGGNDGKTVLIENRTALSKQIISNFYRPNLYFGLTFISVGVIGIVLSVFLPQLSKIWWYVIMGFVAVIGALFLTIYFQNKKNELFDENKSQTYSFDEDALYFKSYFRKRYDCYLLSEERFGLYCRQTRLHEGERRGTAPPAERALSADGDKKVVKEKTCEKSPRVVY